MPSKKPKSGRLRGRPPKDTANPVNKGKRTVSFNMQGLEDNDNEPDIAIHRVAACPHPMFNILPLLDILLLDTRLLDTSLLLDILLIDILLDTRLSPRYFRLVLLHPGTNTGSEFNTRPTFLAYPTS
ncbi:hypothetical protein GE21DRAFT_5421 [Neurospora crassa]|uniref:Uncharacterized protein n=1 Tax=Neurospora crassa (strain ATCC 24698 / 74-OR23-1A / CBS 708.71 / DSM 1257 / FGSC 987) TaxID=367110 RepID=Q7S2K2_NEUCR|nr:hypothetical protein NCU04974 [Neurospora crassa OR74A]EAA29648.2 hypothetical protein NCU04974 [Neurospora crassa OR74A]KHE80119.1 hypothetical protein GE21DRAFT_5421 [Neurospora crassa]|eukprot:XP_958884.2 hypothetical protein NCU04974 [Neurospora crassa OR74A]